MVKVIKKVDVTAELKDIERELQQVIESHKEEVTKFQQEIDTAKANEQKAKQIMLNAKKGDDPKAYAKAVAEQRTASDIVGFYAGKLEKLKAEPLITEADYKEYSNRIKAELDKINNEGKEKARELLAELSDIEPEITININKGNDLLSTLQHKVYKDDASMVVANGNRVHMDHLENRYKDYELIQCINSINNTPYVTSIFKERGNN